MTRCAFLRTYLQTRVRLAVFCLCEDCDEAFALCSLSSVCVWRAECADTCLAAIAGTYASRDLAGKAAPCAACSRAGNGGNRFKIFRCWRGRHKGGGSYAPQDGGLISQKKKNKRCKR